MGTGRAYVSALGELASIADAEERRRVWRQAAVALAQAMGRGRDAPLEGLDPQALLAAARSVIADGLAAEVGFLAPATTAIATFTLAGALPPGPERRELGRRVLAQLDTADADTFAALVAVLALGSRRPLAGALKQARVAVALSAPLGEGTGADALALALLGGPALQRDWLDEPSTGSLPSRRTAARVLERAAREAVRRLRLGDDGGMVTLGRTSVRVVWDRLLGDRESLVWRHAAVARGLLCGHDRELAGRVDRELAGSDPSAWRRAAASLSAGIEVEPEVAARCHAFLDGDLPRIDPGVVRGLLAGLAGVFTINPEVADDLARRAVERAGLEAVEALADLRQDVGTLGPRAVAAARACLDQARAGARPGAAGADDGLTALLAALAEDLTGDPAAVGDSLSMHAAGAREALRGGRIAEARRAAGAAADAAAEAIEFLERADDGDPVDRRHTFRILRELDRELLADGTVVDLLAIDSGTATLGTLQARLEDTLLARESATASGAIAHPVLRLAQLRALIRTVDTDTPPDDTGGVRDRRLAVIRALLPRARLDRSPLRRAVWAALTRTFDAMLRDEQLELSDLVAGWTSAMDPDEDFTVAREASMVPEARAALDGYASAMAIAGTADPGDRAGTLAAIAACGPLLHALAAVSSPRTDALRAHIGFLVRALDGVARARGRSEVSTASLEQLEISAAVLADVLVGARRRLGLPVPAVGSPAALHTLARSTERLRRGAEVDLEADVAAATAAAAHDQCPLVARVLGLALARLARLPDDPPRVAARAETDGGGDDAALGAELPPWLPASRTLGGFFVLRPLGRGTGGSVFVACRTEERHRPAPPAVALKVPDYDGGAARNLSADQFEALFRAEAGTLLSLPAHPNLARFITFDAGAQPKPILVMEYVDGQTLEQLLDLAELDAARALGLIDGIAAGLEVMHRAHVAHLDAKPANVILRGDASARTPVLVDFGLSGRRLRPGCGTPHYGAPEVWSSDGDGEPFGADVYALGCLIYELLTHEVLVDGDTINDVVAAHVDGKAEARARARFGRDRRTADLAAIIAAAVQRRAARRPPIGRVRAGLAAIAGDLARMPWPLPPA